MATIVKTLKESALDKLSATGGKELDISANLTDPGQFEAILESHAHSQLGSTYVIERCDLLKRLTNSYGGRFRSDIVEIGKAPDMAVPPSGGSSLNSPWNY